MILAISRLCFVRVCFSIALMLSVAPGCSGRPKNFAKKVSGKVTVGGQPLAGATIMFMPIESGSPSMAKTNDAGEYSLMWAGSRHGRPVEGAQIGEHVVSITTIVEGAPNAKPPRAGVPEKVPFKYRVEAPPKATVKAGSNTIDFALEAGPIDPPEAKGKAKGKAK
jgi:hypothetical protein